MMTSKTVKLHTNKNLNPPSAIISPQSDPEWLDISIHSVDCCVVIWYRNTEGVFHLLMLLEICMYVLVLYFLVPHSNDAYSHDSKFSLI